MESILVLVFLVAAFSYSANGQISPEYGEACNSAFQCKKYSDNADQNVLCMFRTNGTTPEEVSGTNEYCSVFAVGGGRCQCARNCGPFNDYHDDGEFDPEEGRCVGFVGKLCYNGYGNQDCVQNANCVNRFCACENGYVTAEDGKHCVEEI